MSNYVGTASSMVDLLSQLQALLTPVGWGTNRKTATDWFCTDASGNYFNFRVSQPGAPDNTYYSAGSYPDCLICMGSSGFDASKDAFNQPGKSLFSSTATCFAPFYAGPFSRFYLFYSGTYFHVVLEVISGVFAHLYVGTLNKETAAYSGGQYVAASAFNDTPANGNISGCSAFGGLSGTRVRSTSVLRIQDIDNFVGSSWNAAYTGQGTNNEGTYFVLSATSYGVHPLTPLLQGSANSINNSTLLVPNSIFYRGAQSRLRYLGIVPDMAACDMAYLAPGDIVSYGTEQWQVFPTFSKSSGNLGVAFKIAG